MGSKIMKLGVARRFSDKGVPESSGFDQADALATLTSLLSLKAQKTTLIDSPKVVILSKPVPEEKKETLEDVVLQNAYEEVLTYTQKNMLVMKCAQAIHEAHQQRKIHGDINLSNFVVKIEGENISVKLIGFDPTFVLQPTETSIKTPKKRGTEGYIAPEVAEKGYSVKSDIYSFGCMLKVLAESGFGNRFEFLAKRMCLKLNLIKNPEIRQSLEDTIKFLNQNGFKTLKDDGKRIGEYRHRWEPSGEGMRFTNKNM